MFLPSTERLSLRVVESAICQTLISSASLGQYTWITYRLWLGDVPPINEWLNGVGNRRLIEVLGIKGRNLAMIAVGQFVEASRLDNGHSHAGVFRQSGRDRQPSSSSANDLLRQSNGHGWAGMVCIRHSQIHVPLQAGLGSQRRFQQAHCFPQLDPR